MSDDLVSAAQAAAQASDDRDESLRRDIERSIAASVFEERRATRRLPKRAEPRIVDPATYQRQDVNLSVAADYLECDRRALHYFIDSGQLPAFTRGRRRRVAVADLVAFRQRQRGRSA